LERIDYTTVRGKTAHSRITETSAIPEGAVEEHIGGGFVRHLEYEAKATELAFIRLIVCAIRTYSDVCGFRGEQRCDAVERGSD
jgi:hypothetical protein